MQGKTHLFTGLVLGIPIGIATLMASEPEIAVATFATTAVGSIYPDIDNPKSMLGSKIKPISFLINKIFGHRNFIHSPFNLLLISILFSILFITGGKQQFFLPLFGFCLGFLLHLILDTVTVGGISWLYPFSKKRFHWTRMRTGGMGEKIFIAGTLICIGAIIPIIIYFVRLYPV